MANPDQRVKQGDRIFEVNGVRGDALGMVQEFRGQAERDPRPQQLDLMKLSWLY